MRAVSAAAGAPHTSRLNLAPAWRGHELEPVLARFAGELSPAKGQAFFERLVEFVSEGLGFDAALVGEVAEGASRFVPIAEYPVSHDDMTRAVIATHCDHVASRDLLHSDDGVDSGCLDVPLVGTDGKLIGLLCGLGHSSGLDRSTLRMLLRMVAHRAAAELEHRRAQRELQRRDALYIGLVAEAHDVVAVIDDGGAFTAVSPAIERVLGHSPESCVGRQVVEFVHPIDRPAVEALLRIPGSQDYSAEVRLLHQNLSSVTMAVTVAAHQDGEGRRFKVFSARDLTDQRRLEERLRQSQKTEMIGRLASGIAHDFGNILMVVGSHADIMRLRTDADDPRHADVDAIQAAVTRGADLARQLLAFSRHREFEITRMDVNACVEQLVALVRRLVGSSICLETRLSPDARYIAANVTQIEQIVLNLTLNARDAMPNGGTITFVTEPAADDTVCLSVIDTGCGMPAELLPKIFEPLFTTKQDGSGSGMGLANVHDIVMRHGGSIEVESVDGQGTTFRIFLPRNVVPMLKAAAPN